MASEVELLVLCSQLLVAWQGPALAALKCLKRAQPDPNLIGFGTLFALKSNGLLDKCKLFSPAALYGKSWMGKVITDASGLRAVELDCFDCGHELQTPQHQVRA